MSAAMSNQAAMYANVYEKYYKFYPELQFKTFPDLVSWMSSDDDSLDVDITISGSRNGSAALPSTPPPTSRTRTWLGRLQGRLAFCALCVFLLVFLITVVLVISSAQRAASDRNRGAIS